MHWNEHDFLPLAFDAEVMHALACLHSLKAQRAQFLPPDGVIEQGEGSYAPSSRNSRNDNTAEI